MHISKIVTLVLLGLMVSTMSLARQYGNEWINPNQSYYKISTARDGIYRIGYADLQQAGFDMGVDPRRLRLYHRGEEVAIHIQGQEDARFDASDYIEFYGRKNDGTLDAHLYEPAEAQTNPYFNIYSDTTAYFLTYSLLPENGRRMATYKENNVSNLPAATYHTQKVVESYHEFYNLGIHYPQNTTGRTTLSRFDYGEGWQANSIGNGQSATYTIPLLHAPSSSGPAPTLKVKILGKSSNTHDLTITAGSTAGNVSFQGWGAYMYETPLSRSDIVNGTLAVTVQVNSTIGDFVGVSYIEVQMAQTTDMAGQGMQVFRLPANAANKTYLSVANSPTAPRLFDISDEHNIVRVGLNEGSGTFNAVVRETATPRTLLATGPDYMVPPVRQVDVPSFDLDQAGFVIITHKDLRQAGGGYSDPVEAYADYRRSPEGGGHKVLIAEVDDLYNAFSFGERTPLAMFRFTRYLYENSDPQYLFLVGKSLSWHTFFRSSGRRIFYRDEPSMYQVRDYVPTAGSPGSDEAFTAGLGTSIVEAAVPTGRLNVYNSEQIGSYLDKVKEMEAKPYAFLWRKNILHLSGGIDEEQEVFLDYVKDFEYTAEGTYLGGNVTTISKKTNNTVEAINISDEVNKGLAMVTFFGHSAPAVTDIEIGFATDPVLDYSNRGKYPVFMVNGCEAGDIFNINPSFGEDWISAKEKGAIAFMAHSDLGYASLLKLYSDLFYEVAFSEEAFRDKGIGDVKQEVGKRFLRLAPPFDRSRAQVQQIVLQGDPAVRIFGASKPDYHVEGDQAFITSETGSEVFANDQKFTLSIPTHNFGIAVRDSLYVQVTRTLSDNTALPLEEYTFAPLYYSDTLQIEIDASQTNNFGNNRFEVTVDAGNLIDELNEENNTLVYEVFIPRRGTLNLSPYPYAIVSEPDVRLIAQSGAVEGEERVFLFEIDTAYTFDSPLKSTHEVTGRQLAFLEASLPSVSDSTVFFWRTKFAQTRDGEVNEWTQSSFSYIADGPEGWAQLSFRQLTENKTEGLFPMNFQENWVFRPAETLLKVKTQGRRYPDISPDLVEVEINGLPYILENRLCRMNAYQLIAFDRNTALPYLPENGNFISSGVCGRLPQVITSYTSDYVVTTPYITTYFDALKRGDHVVLFSMSAPREDFPQVVLDAFASVGVAPEQLAGRVRGEPLIFLGMKGAAPGTAIVVRGDENAAIPPIEQEITLETTISGSGDTGTLFSPVIGPSLNWKEIAVGWEATANDIYSVRMYGVDSAFHETFIDELRVSGTSALTLDATKYPYMRLEAVAIDSIDRTAPQPGMWLVDYTPAPEGILLRTATSTSDAIIQEGASVETGFQFVNLSSRAFAAPFYVEATLYNNQTGRATVQEVSIPAAEAFDTVNFSLTWDTRNMPGTNNLSTVANARRQPEQNYNNNFINLLEAIQVAGDDYQPVLDLTFNGRNIQDMDYVKPDPYIVVRLYDENSAWLKQDTLGTQLLIKADCDSCSYRKVSFSNPAVSWSSATEQSPFTIRYQSPTLADGTYRLRVIGSDAAGNTIGPEPFEIRFRVSAEPSVLLMAPYPNPFSDEIHFPVRVLGADGPDQVQLELFDMRGRKVRYIDLPDPAGSLAGDRTITLSWDGQDEKGNLLPPGLYIYRFTIIKDGSEMTSGTPEPGDDMADSIGKIVITR